MSGGALILGAAASFEGQRAGVATRAQGLPR